MTEQALIVGKKEVMELLENNPQKIEKIYLAKRKDNNVQKIISLSKSNKIKVNFVSKQDLNKMGTQNHQGYAARIFPAGFQDIEQILLQAKQVNLPVLIALDQLQDPVNIGNIARTIYAIGGAGLILTKNRSASLYPGAYKTSAGSLDNLPVARTVNMSRFLTLCQAKSFATYFTGTGDTCNNIYKVRLNLPAVLVLGNEEKGVRPNVAKKCLMGLKIPMLRKFDSLNAAQAGGIILGEFLRQYLKAKENSY